LAAAYGVERDFEAVVGRIANTLFPSRDLRGLAIDPEWSAVAQIVGVLALDGRILGRVYRDSVAKRMREQTMALVAARDLTVPPGAFVELVFNDIRSALGSLAH
jgi:hypothetical protein